MNKSTFAIDKVASINIGELHEWKDNPIKRQSIPDQELRQSIEEHGLTVDTMAVVPNGKGYIVVDGNRRLRIARELGLKGNVLAKVYPKEVDMMALAIKLNGIGTSWDRQTYVQFVVGHPERIDVLPKRYRVDTAQMYELLGKDFEWFAMNCKPNAYNWGVQLVKYLGKADDLAFTKKTVLWIGKHKLVRETRRAIDSSASKQKIIKSILANKPIRVTVTSDVWE